MENDTIGSYLNSIKKYPLLSSEEEGRLSDRIEAGDREAFRQLVNSNLRLVVSIARKMNASPCCVMDLIQEGSIGLMTAAEKFRSRFNTRFSTYAYPWILQYMMKFLNGKSNIISLPNRKEHIIRNIQKAQSDFFQHNGREASVVEISLFTGIPEEKVRECLFYSYTVASLDVEVSEEENSASMGELLPDSTYSPEELLMKEDSRASIRKLMDSLPGNEKCVLWYRYNFDGEMHAKTLREISGIIGISPEAVRQTEIRAVKHMKSAVEKNIYAV